MSVEAPSGRRVVEFAWIPVTDQNSWRNKEQISEAFSKNTSLAWSCGVAVVSTEVGKGFKAIVCSCTTRWLFVFLPGSLGTHLQIPPERAVCVLPAATLRSEGSAQPQHVAVAGTRQRMAQCWAFCIVAGEGRLHPCIAAGAALSASLVGGAGSPAGAELVAHLGMKEPRESRWGQEFGDSRCMVVA